MDYVPLDAFSVDALLRLEPGVVLMAAVEAWDLLGRQQTLNFPGIRVFMASRYHHWFDDIDDAELLSADAGGAQPG